MDLSRFKFYAAGKRVSRRYHDRLVDGKTRAKLRYKKDKPGAFWWAFINFQIEERNGKLVRDDPSMVETLWSTGLEYEQTYVMVRQSKDEIINPIEDSALTYFYRYER